MGPMESYGVLTSHRGQTGSRCPLLDAHARRKQKIVEQRLQPLAAVQGLGLAVGLDGDLSGPDNRGAGGLITLPSSWVEHSRRILG